MPTQSNILGDIRAEHDKRMLEMAFYETPDYRTLIESSERPIVVGRRGTGKSALCNQLKKYWQTDPHTFVVHIVPEEDQVIGMRPLLESFGEKYNLVKAAARIAWRYGLLLEVAIRLVDSHKFSKHSSNEIVFEHVDAWRKIGKGITCRVKQLLQAKIQKGESAAATIGNLSQLLQVNELQEALVTALAKTRLAFVFLIDQLDEGFEPDDLGVGLVGGFIHAAVDINSQVRGISAFIFVRDNIFKTLAQLDPDYSKNIEGRFLRLHWDEHQLFDLVCARLKIAFQLNLDGNRKIWNRCTANDLQEKSGFEKCLRLTLYRPRDVVSLLNEAFYNAKKQGRNTLVLKDVESTAREISNTRLDDLLKEYAAIIPVLKLLTSTFHNRNPELSYKEAIESIELLFNNQKIDAAYQREFAILETAQEGIRTLYSVGFLGIKDSASNAFVFCHDGRSPNKQFQPQDRLLIHPCYWMALDASRSALGADEAADIHDEYEVEVFSEAPEIRNHRIGQLIAKLDKIPIGTDGASEFEEWCLKAVRICFSGPLRNIELHPNKNSTSRRDIVASNQSDKGAWRRVLDDYKSRQVIFEIKNKLGIEPDDYRQMHSYLGDDYGRIGFIITRDKKMELYSGPELEQTREFYNRNRVIIVKLNGYFFYSLLSKLRSHHKTDQSEHAINKLLDTYTRLYLTNAKISNPPSCLV